MAKNMRADAHALLALVKGAGEPEGAATMSAPAAVAAGSPLSKGFDSQRDFEVKLYDACRAKLKLGKDESAWPEDYDGEFVIFSCSNGKSIGPSAPNLVRVPYTRDGDKIVPGTPQKVVRRVDYVAMQKSKAGELARLGALGPARMAQPGGDALRGLGGFVEGHAPPRRPAAPPLTFAPEILRHDAQAASARAVRDGINAHAEAGAAAARRTLFGRI